MVVDHAAAGDQVSVLLNQTPFYAESGGQVGDAGTITGRGRPKASSITETQKKLGDLFVHVGRIETGTVKIDDPVVARTRPCPP